MVVAIIILMCMIGIILCITWLLLLYIDSKENEGEK